MRGKRLLLVAVVALPLAFTLSWWAHDRTAVTSAAPTARPLPAKPPPAPPAQVARRRPDRLPELTGTVEQVRVESGSAGPVVVKLLVVVRLPPAGRLKPTDLDFNYRAGDRVWINARVPAIPIEQGGGPVGVGEFVIAWCERFQVRTDLPKHYAECVVSETAPRE